MKAQEVLDIRSAVLDQLRNSRVQRIVGVQALGLWDRLEGGNLDLEEVSRADSMGRVICEPLVNSLGASEAFHVSAEMMTLLRYAATDLDDDATLTHQRLPTEHGFLVFDEPWLMPRNADPTVNEAVTTFCAIQWGHGGHSQLTGAGAHGGAPGIWVTTYSRLTEPRDETYAERLASAPDGYEVWRASVGDWPLRQHFFVAYHEPVGPETVSATEYATPGHPYGDDRNEGAATNPRRLVLALFGLLSQTLVETGSAPVERSARRRAERVNMSATVQSVKLRRKKTQAAYEEEGKTAREWSSRWIVRGNWAWRACGQDHPSAEEYEKGWHAWVYIPPYIKGPEGKEIALHEKVWYLAR